MTTGRINQVSAYHQRQVRCCPQPQLSQKASAQRVRSWRRTRHWYGDQCTDAWLTHAKPVAGRKARRKQTLAANPWLESKHQRCSFQGTKAAQQVQAHKLEQIPTEAGNSAQTPRRHVQTSECSVPAGAAQSSLATKAWPKDTIGGQNAPSNLATSKIWYFQTCIFGSDGSDGPIWSFDWYSSLKTTSDFGSDVRFRIQYRILSPLLWIKAPSKKIGCRKPRGFRHLLSFLVINIL